ncbi:pyridoxamine 5'-phosphate oxidase family protein [Pricia sp. S334]|uniref:Pyridoxamine 5'-phosphate oxidase family protein n=1 Tax=Pricia mediterranea TaxID=3076079 RepID=A0ABU3L050_9FLAO|nr:pyridoxamine 5'-phosphate oxidase family protein [Pricia sp. S334]MDT7827106.1 pyridoxamine 5'-phosphate oxidase family protein [Pricia sp. S334]
MSEDNLFNEDARAKIKELVENIDFAMMETHLGAKQTHIVPMSTKDVDDDGSIWFLSNKNSEHNNYIRDDDSIQLIYAKPGDMEFLIVFGKASIITERPVLEKYYGKTDDTWFDGVDDPNLTAIKVRPEDAHYWDSKNGKLVSLLKMGVGAITGEEQDMGKHGNLNP